MCTRRPVGEWEWGSGDGGGEMEGGKIKKTGKLEKERGWLGNMAL